MTNDELIAEAYRRYPVGTRFESIFSDKGKVREVQFYEGQEEIKWKKGGDEISAYNGILQTDKKHDSASAVIYRAEEWTPIIEPYSIY